MPNMTYEELSSLMTKTLKKYEATKRNVYFGTYSDWVLEILPMNEIKNSLGLCKIGYNTIILSKEAFDYAPQNILKEIILHECAHALAGVELGKPTSKGNYRVIGHGKTWRKYAIMVGAEPKATIKYSFPSDVNKFAEQKKWAIVHLDGDIVHKVSSCKRKLKNLKHRHFPSIENTLGNLWLVDNKIWNEHKDDVEMIKQYMVR